MKHYTTFDIVAKTMTIIGALASMIILGLAISFMVYSKDQTQEVRTVKTGDISWLCLDTKAGSRIVAESCEILPDGVSGESVG